MKHEILFRGKRLDNGEWVYWNAFGEYTEPFVSEVDMHSHVSECDIDPDTVGQFIGRTDKHGKKIFEGDIVTYPDGDGGYEYCDVTINSGVVTWENESALFYITNNYSAEFPDTWDCTDEIEVIGNAWDNPELMQGVGD